MVELVATAQESADALPLTQVCQALALSRATYSRWLLVGPAPDEDMALRAQIQDIALERPADGYRRMMYALQRRDLVVNHKRVLRLMREDNLWCLRTRGLVRTTDSAHALTVYPTLLPAVTVEGLAQWWVADLTYLRLPQALVYLAGRLEAYRRRCLGWALDRDVEAELALAALRMALATRAIRPGLVHHSDRGVP